MSAEQFIPDWLSKKYFDAKEVGDWTPEDVVEIMESFAKQEVKRACKHQRYLCADEIKYDPEVESTIIDDFKDSVLNAQEPKI